MELIKKENKGMITSVELVKQINVFREEEGGRAELQHYDFIKIIKDEFDEEISLGNISESKYLNERGREYDCFNLTLDQAKMLLMRESKIVRKAVVNYINKLEEQLMTQTPKLPTTYLEALEDLIAKEKMLIEQKPKVEYFDKVLDSKSTYTTTQIAKEMEMSAIQLNVLLSNLGVQFKQSGQWQLTAKHQDKGYTKVRTHLLDNQETKHSTVWTELGRKFLLELSEEF